MNAMQAAQGARHRLIVGVDQRPFFAGTNQFCLAYPLLVEETGESLDPKTFENRDRLWWKVDNVAGSELLPGSLHVAMIEPAPAYEAGNPERDRYQVRLSGRQPSSELWLQVLDVPGPMPKIDDLFAQGVPAKIRPWKRVLLRFEDCIAGPFLGVWESARQTLSLKHLDSDSAEVTRIPAAALNKHPGSRILSWTACMYERGAEPEEIEVEIFQASMLKELLASGGVIDAMPLDEVAFTYSKRLRASDFKRPVYDEPMQRIRAMANEDDAYEMGRIARLEKALDVMRSDPEAAKQFSPKARVLLQAFFPPVEPASEPVAMVSQSQGAAPKKAPKPRPVPTGPAAPAVGEAEFFEYLDESIAATGYRFEQSDLLAFHLGMKASQLSVLAGRSGVGKSSLPRLYARALGAQDTMLTVPVRPDWLDDRDVVGAYDSLSRRFVPAATGLVDFLAQAGAEEDDPEAPVRMLVLDEMNLARVEYYFATFLSAMEQPPATRGIRLFSEGLLDDNDPYQGLSWLPIPSSLRIVGTVNIDETTHFFSPKVLDRACVQMFERPDLRRMQTVIDETAGGTRAPVSWRTWSSWIGRGNGVDTWVQQRLADLNDLLVPLRSDLGYRTMHRCLHYVAGANGLGDFCTTQQALDLAIVQFVLPRLRTDQPDFLERVDEILSFLAETEYPKSHALIARMKTLGGVGDFWQLS
jgi:energy-coupling factor transporter ATP-binding protein EcfA2